MLDDIYKNHFDSNKIALKYKNKSITYGELDTKISKFTSYFSCIGIKEGDKVVLVCHNTPEFIYSYLSVIKLGAIVVPVNLLLTVDEIKYVIKNSEAKTLIVHPIILTKLAEGKSFAKRAAFKLVNTSAAKTLLKLFAGVNIVVLDEELQNKVDKISTFEYTQVSDKSKISTFLYTSGTTGKPKAAMLTHHNLISNVDQISNTIEVFSHDNFLCVLPMFHSFAFTTCVLLPLYHGATITILPRFQPKELTESLANDDITVFCGVPSMYVILLNAVKDNIGFPKLRLAISGGASLPLEIYKRSKKELNFPIIEGYGLSEASPVCTLNPISVSKAGSIGTPLVGVECKIIDESGKELPNNTVGELAVKGENVMLGYYRHEEVAIVDGWLYTGDIAKKDENGYIFIVDRKKDLIIVGGLNIYPREIEEVIYQFPKVKEVAVVGINDDLRGEYVKAYVVLKDGETCHSKQLIRFLKERLAQYKLPRKIDFLDELPKNETGKILKKELKNK